jgi:putative ABC transport system permease protein
MLNWLSQISAITLANLRTLPERRGAAVAAAVGIAGVVTVLVGVLSIAEGFQRVLAVSGSPDVAIVLRSGSDAEMNSGLTHEDTRLIADAPGLARNASNLPLASAELFVVINLPKRSTGTDANVPLRGVSPTAFDVRGNITMLEGRRFEPGKNELIVGAGAARQFSGLDVGKTVRVGQTEWAVVGVFTAGGGVAESEVWTDAAVLQPAYHRGDTYQAVYAKLISADALHIFVDALTTNPQLSIKAVRQSDFYAEQSTTLVSFVKGIGITIAALMAVGALFGALNTMYSSVAARTREIATLRALGFGSSPVVVSVLLESLALALAGGVLGAGGAWLAFDGHTTSTMNWQTFSQVAFAFRVSPALLGQAIFWAAMIGVLGGLFPAIRAARIPIAAALRET